MKIMNPKSLIYIFLMAATLGISQTPTQDDLYTSEVANLVKVPVSPEAAAFAQYGNTPVNLFSGIPDISIPLHTLSGVEMQLPISLTYDASGVKVEALASWVGLNWNLNVGGRITRVVNGLPDDYFFGGSYSTISTDGMSQKILDYSENNTRFANNIEAVAYFNFLNDIQTNFTDAQPDYYMLSLPGMSETIVVDITDGNTPKALNNPRIKVEVTTSTFGVVKPITGWKITNEDGTIYHFNTQENTEVTNNDTQPSGAINYRYTSSWLLSEIESPNRKDHFQLNYSSPGYWSDTQLASSAVAGVTKIVTTQTYYPAPDDTYTGSAQYKIAQQFLSSISNNSKTLLTTTLANRNDVNSTLTTTRLEKVDLFDYQDQPLRTIVFDNNHYFNIDEYQDPHDIRLKLDGLQIKGADDKIYQTYAFEYDRPNELPSRYSRSQDYLGYFNNAGNGNTIYPKFILDNTYTLEGADRDPNADKAKIGLLKKITYPTGGYTEFDYESHEIYKSATSTSAVPYLNLSVHSTTPTDANLFRDDNGVECDDAYSGSPKPKMKIVEFVVDVSGDYDIKFTGNTAKCRSYLQFYATGCKIKNGVEVCPTNPFDNYCDFLTMANAGPYDLDRDGASFTVNLQQGFYTAMLLVEPTGSTWESSYLDITRDVTSTTAGNEAVGGIRLAQTRDYPSSGATPITKDYDYTEGNNESTGTITYAPSLIRIQNFRDSNGNPVDQVVRTAAFPKGDAPFVTYSSVTEKTLDANGFAQGYTTYEFYGGLGGTVPQPSPPYENSYNSSLSIGNPRFSKVFNDSDQMVSQTETQYFEGPEGAAAASVAQTRGIVVFNDQSSVDKVVVTRWDSDGMGNTYVTYDYREYNCSSTPCQVPVLTHPDIAAYPAYATLRMRLAGAAGTYGGVSAVITEQRFGDLANNPEIVTTTETTTYDSAVEYLPRDIRNTNSKGEDFETRNFYPKDMVVNGSQALLDKNCKAIIVGQDIYKDLGTANDNISKLRREYVSVATNVVVPDTIKTAKGSDGLESRVILDYYDDGMLRESKQVNGPSTFYIWNSRGLNLLAKIENATKSQVEGISGIGADFRPVANSLTAQQELDLRNGLPNAMVTTYVHNPLIGLLEMTDPKGYKTTYEYDDFQRLVRIKDAVGNLISDYQYHYKTEQ